MTKEIISKVNEELKAQGINATEAQIEGAVKEVIGKQELTEDVLDNVAGGGIDPETIKKYAPQVIDIIKKILPGSNGDENKDGGNDDENKNGGTNITQNNKNEKSNQLVNVEGANTQTTNTFNFN